MVKKRKLKRVYFDNMIFDLAFEDQVTQAAFRFLHERKRLALSLSPINLDELYSMAGDVARRERANALLMMALDLGWPRILKEPSQLLDEAGEEVCRGAPVGCPFQEGGPRSELSLRRIVEGLLRMPDTEVRDAADKIHTQEKRGKEVFQRIHGQVREEVARRGEVGSQIPFDDFRSMNVQDRILVLQVSRPLRKRRDRVRASRHCHPLLTRIADVLLYRVWVERVRSGPMQTSSRFWVRDMQQVVYLPFVDIFVTEDRVFREALMAIAGPKERIMSFDRFGAWCRSEAAAQLQDGVAE